MYYFNPPPWRHKSIPSKLKLHTNNTSNEPETTNIYHRSELNYTNCIITEENITFSNSKNLEEIMKIIGNVYSLRNIFIRYTLEKVWYMLLVDINPIFLVSDDDIIQSETESITISHAIYHIFSRIESL